MQKGLWLQSDGHQENDIPLEKESLNIKIYKPKGKICRLWEESKKLNQDNTIIFSQDLRMHREQVMIQT